MDQNQINLEQSLEKKLKNPYYVIRTSTSCPIFTDTYLKPDFITKAILHYSYIVKVIRI